MNVEELLKRLDIVPHGNEFRVNARESTDLEFKLEFNLATLKKSLKTIAAFANKGGVHCFWCSRQAKTFDWDW